MTGRRSLLPLFDHRRLSSCLRTLRAVNHREDLHPALRELCMQYNVAHMTFLVVRAGGGSSAYPYYATTYPDMWAARYVDNGYFDIDPVIDVMRWGFLPVDWSSLDRRSGRARRLFKEARSYGIGSQGLTVPVRGSNGERSLFSVTSRLPRREWSRLRDSSIHEMQILSHYLHETVFEVVGYRKFDRIRKLSGRESQCLRLLAMGRISKQIAADLGISENAVKLYLRSARLKLGAVTSYQAVARASFLELIRF
ncbi:helix-turn-helix transcriptional regulator [Ensifer adhaerens]|uniref:helix-turn-helix transcriptional regulator n=1 Tax=Ensifer adhaerens TaxID=106592 RepID=UPI001C4E1BC5|nr:LuxR family transcriptional regulator [Ensifer adhaerens]MBW0367910.1 LuxR family transcriptional regulator [Ensifer adhaerens]UCM24874.1 LuxR family transcriptional regulator [Ensifer adhaerens]